MKIWMAIKENWQNIREDWNDARTRRLLKKDKEFLEAVKNLPVLKQPEEMTKDELKSYSDFHLTVGRLKEILNKHPLPDDAVVVIQRIEDRYFEKHGWKVYVKKDCLTDEPLQYHPAFCCPFYMDDPDILFINLHY